MTSTSLQCLNCEDEMPPLVKPRLYCSLACEQEAELIRYVRRSAKDGRIDRDDVQIAIHTRLAHIMAGGYDKESRKLSRESREAVLQRSKGKCEACGKDGHDIDHIDGPSADLSNLQFLCKDCHNRKTQLRIVPVKPGMPQYDYVKSRTAKFWKYVRARKPVRVCHDDEKWNSLWRQFQSKRKAFATVLKGNLTTGSIRTR